MKKEVQLLLKKYEEQLVGKGICITFSQKYREETVLENSGGIGVGSIMNEFFRRLDRKRENEKYYDVKNRYYCIVLTVSPTDKKLLPLAYYKQYSFVVKKIERAHIGLEPERKEYASEKVLRKIERRIQKILQKAEKYPPQKVCCDTFWDVFRYMDRQKRGYKSQILGKSCDFWDMVSVGIAVGALLLFLIICYFAF